MIYQFEYDEIHHCNECPLFYDYMYCELLNGDKKYSGYTDSDDNKRPDWCPLKELPELKPELKPEDIQPTTLVKLVAYAKRPIPNAIELTYEFLSILMDYMSKEDYLQYINIVKTIFNTEVIYND